MLLEIFFTNNFIEVEAPIIINNPCIEDNIDAIKCSNNYLRTSPELYHKRILSSGISKYLRLENALEILEMKITSSRIYYVRMV